MKSLYVWTQDGLRLQAMQYPSENKQVCILFIHGMSGNFMENYYADVVGNKLQENNIGFIYSHNRGYNHINDVATKEITKDNGNKTIRIGAAYEKFEDSFFDIDGWMTKTIELGYKKIVLAGHSLGSNKVINYFYSKESNHISGVILLSPPDMVANGKESGRSAVYEKQLKEAQKNVSEGNPKKLLSDKLWNWYNLSSETFLNMFVDRCPADNLPIMRNPEEFPELASINVPILSIMGEHDDIAVRTLQDDMDLIEKRATGTKSFTKKFIAGANHGYENRENELAEVILNWVKSFNQ
ncbi:hypothetical protein A3A55_01580 [Candidatus Roizmanbacteria bacterium RIFCSPLOWO2_01_FULL_40_14]|uniref:Serine aminopeptidase S33 domain-containing protein n=2 Tax=Candidatus Roizmaniibacteriota TaxID=1752723 RepID=A0A0G0VKL4_9BACT|nr:MAG: hypothetical protein UU14_C0005G0028 [Candidatus Roizmanbacteria bacterium GW2011_GWB1_40_7]KKR94796.1 MAG: hypothetical protein UU41_C0003G0015 [Candidatus Roizmanbacteria bacterium GW2011_GWA1_41_13]OGK47691.1 MAG: hypothetical protein A3A55_01580 [Candidatus Roizmanbacteria bacterium RIFCSPLOWO2_01_FULL_40_14]